MSHLGLDPEEWLSQSPDLNSIENLWSYLDWNIRDHKVSNIGELWTTLQEGLQALPVHLITRLVDSMPRRLQAVIDSKGYPTKY